MNVHPRHLDKYELRELLGRGGMAEVWKAYDSQLQRYVAIKLLHMDLQNDPDFLTRFVREARVIASLHHPNIVQVYDFQTTTSPENAQPVAYMVMEFIDGLTLAEYIRRTSRQGRYPSGEELVQIFAAISRAIDYAHARGMGHRDIKPANILLDRRNTAHLADGEPILTDFGIARLLGTSTGTLSHTWMGTPLYLSPEQAQGQSGSEQSDIYSLGVILYEMCTGTQPFHGETVPAIILQQISAMPTSPELLNPQITPALSAVILRCLAKDPTRRFHNASSLTVALAETLGQRAPTDISQEATAIQPDPWNQSVTYSPMNMQANGTPPVARQMPPSWPADMSAGPTVPAQTPVNVYPPPGPNPTPPQIQGLTPYITPIQAGPSNLPETPSEPSLKRLPDQNRLSRLKHFARTRPRLLFPYALAGLILLLLVSGLGSVYWFTRPHGAGFGAGNSTVGHVFFVNSGEVSEHNNNGESDGVVVDLQHLRAPDRGKAYYAWMLSDMNSSDSLSLPLGRVSVRDGSIRFQYFDPGHTNLLAITSRFLITQEDASTQPVAPTLDRSAWRYSATLPQTPNLQNPEHFSLLDHLRHLLAADPRLNKLNLPGGLDIWLFRNTEKVLEWSGSARDFWEQKNADGLRNMLIRVLDYLDGSQYVQLDVPPGTPNLVNPRIAPVALLEFDPTKQAPPGYLYHINVHLNGVLNSPGATPEQARLATQIDNDLNNVKGWLQQVRLDAKQLITMPAGDLLSNNTLNILDNMETYARYAYVGKLDPSNNQIQGGVTQIYYQGQALATMGVMEYNGG
jgi:serine/threonine protein kinase